MGPGQFATQCVTNRVGHEERPHVAEVGRVVALAELGLETLGEPFQDSLAVARPSASRLARPRRWRGRPPSRRRP